MSAWLAGELRSGRRRNRFPVQVARGANFDESTLDRRIDGIVGGLIVSVMTALLSVNQLVE